MTQDTRNTRVVVLLIVSMTLGAALLIALEPRTSGWSRPATLSAQHAPTVDAVTIEFVPHDRRIRRHTFDCVILISGETIWDPRPARPGRLRLAVVGSPVEEFTAAQQRALLSVLGSMAQQRGLDLAHVRLDTTSDVRYRNDLPDDAGALRALLVRKGIIR